MLFLKLLLWQIGIIKNQIKKRIYKEILYRNIFKILLQKNKKTYTNVYSSKITITKTTAQL